MLWAGIGLSVVLLVGAASYGALTDDSSLSARVKFEQQGTLFGADEFTGSANQPPAPDRWSIEKGGGGWGNNEKQIYTDDPQNVRLDGQGNLVLEARAEQGRISSARVNTFGKIEFSYGLIDARIKMPKGQGIHPAFWMLGSSIKDVGYPRSGEIDVMELVNKGKPGHTAVHGPWEQPTRHSESKWKLSKETDTGVDLSDDFHTYWVARVADSVTIGIDDDVVAEFTRDDMPEGGRWVMDKPFFVVFNVAVGGDWPGQVDMNAMPATMMIDWVRVYG